MTGKDLGCDVVAQASLGALALIAISFRVSEPAK
jgi:hypothetical protein